MAKRVQFAKTGGPEVLELVDYTPAEPGPHEVRVRNRAIGLNFIDTYYRSGLYPSHAIASPIHLAALYAGTTTPMCIPDSLHIAG